jgi:DNA-binding response OmpR family regulator
VPSAPDEPTVPGLLSVLVVDDEPQLWQMLQRPLEHGHYRAVWAANGTEALARLSAEAFDLVLLDLGLPDVSGLDLCRQIRQAAQEVYLPIIVLTGDQSGERRHQGFEAGADDYVTKPFAVADLLDRVRAWTGARQRLAAAHTRALHEKEQVAVLSEQLAQDEAVLAMARTLSHELTQPLTLLTTILDLQKAGVYTAADSEQVWAEFDHVAQDLIQRVRQLGQVVRYQPKEEAGYRVLDLPRSWA